MTSLWLLQYLIAASISLMVSFYAIRREGKSRQISSALRYFFIFGLLVFVWETATFLQRSAPSPEKAFLFLYLLSASGVLSLPAYLAALLSIRKRMKALPLIFLPAIANIFAFPFVTYDFYLTKYGWSYRVNEFSVPFITEILVYFGYLIAISLSSAKLTLEARSSQLRKKYAILLGSFVAFQVIGIPLTNYLLMGNPDFPPLGGIMHLATFLFIGCALMIREEKIPSFPRFRRDFSEVYSSFLTVLYNKTGTTSFGEESFKFGDFIKESGIENCVSISEKGITFRMPGNLNHSDLINKNLEILEKNFEDSEIVDNYLRVLNAAYQVLGEKLGEIVKSNEDFLKRSDLIYGIANGHFLEKIRKDESLRFFDDVKSCLKIYKRLLLPIDVEILSSIDSHKRLAMHYATKKVRITEYGEILMQEAERSIRKLPEEDQLPIIIESFNSFVGWTYERALKRSNAETSRIINTLQRVLTLNKEKAAELNIYNTFLEILVSRIPRTQIQQLYLEYLEEIIESRDSELKQVQKQLLEAERMAAIGETATMIGHDIRNPLQTIFNALYLAMKKIDTMPASLEEKIQLRNLLQRIHDQAEYINRMILDLQDYVRNVTVELVETDLHELISDVLASIVIPEKIDVVLDVREDLPRILIDPILMKRVLLNLLENAIEAMPEGGKLKISATIKRGNAVIKVRDTGIGIPKENIEEIFKPFFTTKPRDLGLGLAVCQKLVEAQGGKIIVKSEVGKGTEFTVEIPIAK